MKLGYCPRPVYIGLTERFDSLGSIFDRVIVKQDRGVGAMVDECESRHIDNVSMGRSYGRSLEASSRYPNDFFRVIATLSFLRYCVKFVA